MKLKKEGTPVSTKVAAKTTRPSNTKSAIIFAANKFGLTPRETECLQALARLGSSRKAISEKLSISVSTADFHLRNIYFKTASHSAIQVLAKIFF